MKQLTYLKFLIKSTNEHGVHSPFVYQFLTEGIYAQKKIFRKEKPINRILKSTEKYFGINSEHNTEVEYKQIKRIDAITDYNTKSLSQLITEAREDEIIFISQPHKSKNQFENWSYLAKSNNFNVSIDFYYAGLLFKRKEQRKEHFTLRI